MSCYSSNNVLVSYYRVHGLRSLVKCVWIIPTMLSKARLNVLKEAEAKRRETASKATNRSEWRKSMQDDARRMELLATYRRQTRSVLSISRKERRKRAADRVKDP